MSVTYPADATATTYLFTLRGKVNTPTVADARELHNKLAALRRIAGRCRPAPRRSSLAGSGRGGVQRIRLGDDQYRAQVRADRTRDMVATPESGRDDLA